MTDPTELVLTSGFAASLGLFVISATLRARLGRVKTDPAPAPVLPMEGDSPYLAPVAIVMPPELPVGKVPVWFYGPLDLMGAALVFMVFAGLVIASFGVPENVAASLNPSVLAANIGFQFILAGMVAIMVVWRVSWATWLGLRWQSWYWVFVIAPCSVFFMWAVFGGLQYSGYLKWMESLGVETVQDTVKLLQKSDDPVVLGLMAFAAVIAAPLCEEIVFRGYFYPVLKRFAGVWPAAICSAFVFAGAHGSLTALLPLFLFGGLLVFIYEKTGSLWAPISVHFCFNGATVLVQMAARYFNIPLDAVP
jgi:membrane protease YdiL (CAAX protease family)